MTERRTGRPSLCGDCGDCQRCVKAARARAAYAAMTPQQRKEWVGRRDPEKVLASDRARYYRNRAERLARMREWNEKNPERRRELGNAWAARNTEKRKAHYAVNNAVRDGRLTKQPCEVCGAVSPVRAHHDDYTKPLEVRWLCVAHHAEHHRRYPIEEAA